MSKRDRTFYRLEGAVWMIISMVMVAYWSNWHPSLTPLIIVGFIDVILTCIIANVLNK